MKTPLNWINLYTDISALIKEKWVIDLAHIYSTHTAEIDWIEEFLKSDKIVVWKVIEAKKHPDSDHLNIVQVDLWDLWKTQIVCWATNVLDATYVPVATVGTVLGEDFEIKSTKLRWEMSNWMICSEDELWFQEERASGIMRLENYFSVEILKKHIWKPFNELEIDILWIDWNKKWTKLKDVIFEIDNKFITNRPDLFSVEWNAREFGAIFDLQFQPYNKKYNFSSKKLNTKVLTDKVLAYHLIKVDNVSCWISPFGISQMLLKSWINPKFDLVDMTNYIMTELGQPMHAFDADKIKWWITVRMAKNWEILNALNWEKYTLKDSDIVIADDEKVLAIGWIIGWLDSAISETTQNIYIESATFDATTIRLTAQRLWVRTDASTRYEKSQDPLLTYKALARSIEFLNFIWKPWIIVWDSEYIDKSQVNKVEIEFTTDFINKKIWVKIEEKNIDRILTQLGFTFVKNNWTYNVTVPSWRATKDISIKEDIAEEIWRINSYSKVPETPLNWDFTIIKKNKNIKFKQLIQTYFNSNNWLEVYNYSFSNEILDEKIGIINHSDTIRIVNAYSADFTIMRRNMLANILVNVADNKKISDNFAFYEIAKISSKNWEKFNESLKLSWISYGKSFEDFKNYLTWFLDTILTTNNFLIKQWIDTIELSYFHPNKSWEIISKSWENLGYFGYLNPIVASNFDLDDSNILYFELDYSKIFEINSNTKIEFKDLPKFPWIERELNFVMNEKTVVWEVISSIYKCSELIRNISIIDIYRHPEKVWKDKKSITFSISILDYEKTITDDEAMIIQNKIIKFLEKDWIELRR